MLLKENCSAWQRRLGYCQYHILFSLPLASAHVKSPVASLCFVCSSVKNLVSVMMSVLIFSAPPGPSACDIFAAMISGFLCMLLVSLFLSFASVNVEGRVEQPKVCL